MYRVVAAALLVAGLVAWPTGVDAQDVSIDADNVPVIWVDLEGPGGFVSQGDAATGVVDQSHEPMLLRSITVDDGGLRSLSPIDVGLTVGNMILPEPVTGIATSENGALVAASANEFPAAFTRVMASADLRQYVRGDGEPSAADGRARFDLTFSPPLSVDAYLIVTESDPAASLRLSALGADGSPPAPIAVLGAGAGWNTGFASADQAQVQPIRLAVVPVAALVGQTGLSSLATIRVDADDASDFKIMPAAAAGLTTIETDPAVLTTPTPIPADAVAFAATVYPGTDGGAGCEAAPSSTQAAPGAPVTYCYTVTNNGTEPLEQVTVTNPDVGGQVRPLGDVSSDLAPAASARFFLETTPPADDVDGTLVNMATVTAVGSETGHDYSANAEAIVLAPDGAGRPGVAVAVTAYNGHDGGQACPGDDRTVVAAGAPVTYCYVVTNTGNTHVHGLHIDQPGSDGVPDLVGGKRDEMLPLAPGASATFFLQAAAPDTPAAGAVASATVVANPVDEFCGDLPGLADVTANDGTELTSAEQPPTVPQQTGPGEPPTGKTPDGPTDPEAGDPPTRTEAPQAPQTGAPTELAFTGWETWILVMAGVGLVAGGLAVLNETGRRRRPAPVPTDEGRPTPRT